MRILFPFTAYTRDDLCRKLEYFRLFGKGCRKIRRAESLEEVRYSEIQKNRYLMVHTQLYIVAIVI